MSAEGWFDRNEVRRYPFADDVTLGFPDDVIADLSLVVPAALLATDVPVLSSISVGRSYLSFVLRCGSTDVAWFGGSPDTRVPLALTPLVAGAGGFVVLGSGALTWRGVAVPTDAYVAVPAFSAVFDDVGAKISLSNDGMVSTFLENLIVAAGADIAVTKHDVYGPYTNVLRLALNADIDPESNEVMVGNCARNVQNRSCVPKVITSVNGVRSDGSKLRIRFVSGTEAVNVVDMSTAVVSLLTDLSQTRACDNRNDPVDVSGGLRRPC